MAYYRNLYDAADATGSLTGKIVSSSLRYLQFLSFVCLRI